MGTHMGEMNAANGRTWTAVRSMITLVLAPTRPPPRSVGSVVLSLSSHLNSRQSDTERTERTSTYAAATLNF